MNDVYLCHKLKKKKKKEKEREDKKVARVVFFVIRK